eukprot:7037793-Alexandrium_andersonii.AAC.1
MKRARRPATSMAWSPATSVAWSLCTSLARRMRNPARPPQWHWVRSDAALDHANVANRARRAN